MRGYGLIRKIGSVFLFCGKMVIERFLVVLAILILVPFFMAMGLIVSLFRKC